MRFRVKYEIELNGEKHEGVVTEASWFLIDQQGNMYSHGPMEPIRPIEKEYKSAIPLIKIGEEWLSINEIEQRITSAMHLDGEGSAALEKSSIPGDEETFNNGHGW